MKKLSCLILLLSLASCGGNSSGSIHGIMGGSGGVVYVCTGSMSQCYHRDRDSYGLGNCSGTVRAVSLEEARQMGRRPCKFCY